MGSVVMMSTPASRTPTAAAARAPALTISGQSRPVAVVLSTPRFSLTTVLSVKAVPGLTKEYLQRLVNCHLARNASVGFVMPEMGSCPLSVKGATATVESAGPGFRVDIRADDGQAAEEILKKARALTAGK